MGAVVRLLADAKLPERNREAQRVRIKNHPAYSYNKAKRCLCGDPVKDVIQHMQAYAGTADVQERSCDKLRQLAHGTYYNGLVGEYGGIETVVGLLERFNDDALVLYAAVQALTQFAENGPNAEIMRNASVDVVVDRLKKSKPEDDYLQKDCEEFLARLQATGLQLAKEFVENSVIEEDVASLLKYMRRYFDLPDVVEYGVAQIGRFLADDESNVLKFIHEGDLTTFLKIIEANKTQVATMYYLFSILYILAKSPAMSIELGKAGLVKATLDLIREKKSGKQGELLQMLLFTLNRMCFVDSNAIIFHKLYGDIPIKDIEEALQDDAYDYPIAIPYRLKLLMRNKDKYLKLDEQAAEGKDAEREAVSIDRGLYEDESLVKALVFKRPDAVISYKKDQEKWKADAVVFDALSGDTAASAAVKAGRKAAKRQGSKGTGKAKAGEEKAALSTNKTYPEDMVTYGISNQPVIEIEQAAWDPDMPTLPHKGGWEY